MRFDKEFINKVLPKASLMFECFPDQARFCIDVHKLTPGDIFVAFPQVDIHERDSIVDAYNKGAVGYIIEESKKDIINTLKGIEKSFVLLVKDTIETFISLAIAWRSSFSYPVIAITGSVGKTSTKELLSLIMSHQGKSYFVSSGNQNTKLDLALNMLHMNESHELAIFEVGISKRGEMAELANMLRPTTAVITNIGHQHMDGLGSLNDIALEKRDIFKYLTEDSIGIINGDQTILSAVSYQHPVIKFGSKTINQIQARKVKIADSRINFVLKIYRKKYMVSLDHPHLAAVFNTLAATAVAHWLGISDEVIVQAIQKPCVVEGRFEERSIIGARGILINDCYNANPESMKAALLAFEQMETQSPKIAILGDMLGLGVNSSFWHRQVGRFLRKVPSLNKVILVGESVSWIKKTAPLGLKVEVVQSWQQAVEKVELELELKPAILVKGSRAVSLDKLVEKLTGKEIVQ